MIIITRAFSKSLFWIRKTGERGERRLNHCDGRAERFYRDLKQREVSVRVGMEAHRVCTLVRAVALRAWSILVNACFRGPA